MKMSETEFNNFNQAAEKAFQAELICMLVEDFPHQLTDTDISSIASLLKNLNGDVYSYMREVIRQQENQK